MFYGTVGDTFSSWLEAVPDLATTYFETEAEKSAARSRAAAIRAAATIRPTGYSIGAPATGIMNEIPWNLVLFGSIGLLGLALVLKKRKGGRR